MSIGVIVKESIFKLSFHWFSLHSSMYLGLIEYKWTCNIKGYPCSSHYTMFSKKKKKPLISPPSNFEHRVHTGFDKREGKFVGLPLQWASLVGNNQVSVNYCFYYFLLV